MINEFREWEKAGCLNGVPGSGFTMWVVNDALNDGRSTFLGLRENREFEFMCVFKIAYKISRYLLDSRIFVSRG